MPAATLVIWRVTVVPLPTDTAASVAVQVELLATVAPKGLKPVTPLSTVAALFLPNATPLLTVTEVSLPNATAPVMEVAPV